MTDEPVPRTATPSVAKLLSIACPVFVGALSLLVMGAWVVHSMAIVQIMPGFAPMQFNTALCFVLCSATLLLLSTRYRHISVMTSMLVGLFSLMTFVQYPLAVNFGIDTLFIEPFTDVNTVYAGRMAPNTALALMLLSIALYLCATPRRLGKRQDMMIGLVASLAFAMGMVPLLGYLSGVEAAYSWGNFTHMAVHTASFFVLLGVAIMAHAWNQSEKGAMWLPVPIGLAFITIAFSMSTAIHAQEESRLEETLQAQAEHFSEITEVKLHELAEALSRMADRWQAQGGTPQGMWQKDAKEYIQGFAYLSALEVSDKKLIIRWVEPAQDNRQLIGQSMHHDQQARRKAIDEALAGHKPVMTGSLPLLRGGQGFLYFIPLYVRNQFDGILTGVFKVDNFFNAIVSKEHFSSYYVTVKEGDKQIFSTLPDNTQNIWRKQVPFTHGDAEWTIEVSPTPELLQSRSSLIYLVVLGIGLLTAFLVTLCAYLTLKWRYNTQALEDSNRRIIESAKKMLESELRHQQLVDGVLDYAIYWLDLEGHVGSWNSGAERIKQYSAGEVIGQHFSKFYTEEDRKNEAPQKALQTALTNGKFEGEGWRVRKDGSKMWVSVTISPIHDYHGVITAFAKVTRDITERRHFEQTLEATNQLNNAILSSATYMVIATDKAGTVIVFNKEAERALGYSAGEIIGIQTAVFWHDKQEIVARAQTMGTELGETIEPGFDVFIRKLREQESESSEWTFIRKDGSHFPVHVTATALKNNEGAVTGYLEIIEDITERKKTRAERDRLIALVEESADFIGMADLEGNLQYHNRSARRLIGLPEDYDLSHMRIANMHPEWAAKLVLEQGVLAAYKNGSWQGETALLHRDGHEIPVLQNLSLHRDGNGEPVCFTTIMRDITERKKQEAALRSSEETFRLAIENASIGMALVEPDGHFLKVNQALCDMIGYEKIELLHSNFQSIAHPDDLEADQEFIRKMLADESKTYEMEKRYYHKSGRIIWVQLSVSLVRHAGGEPNYFIAQIQDITEQKEIERIKSEFISIVSHELRTPLTSIRGSLGLIIGALSKDLPVKVKGLIDIAHNNCERLILLINDILDIDKIAAGQMRFDMKEESLADITRQAVKANEAYAQKFHTQIALEPLDESIKVELDAGRYIQVISNLLSNAAKFSPPGAVITVSATRAVNRVRMCVRDNGPGIPEEFRARIFSKFSQADSSVTRSKGGTGLGLHIAKQIVEHMKGRIGFETEIGKGTTFWVEFPVMQDNSDVMLAGEHSQLPLILHVEDDADLSNMLATALHDKARVLTATNLHKAEYYLSQKHFDMMILDIGLPDGSGLSLLDRLDRLSEKPLPIVILSADMPPKDIHRQVAAVMVKSRMSETKIVETILAILEQHQGEHYE